MAEEYVLQTIITADSTELQKNLEQAQKSVKKFSTDLQSAIGLLGNLFVVSKMKNFAKAAIGSVQETNKQLKLLDATLKTTGADAWTSQKKLLSMAEKFESSSNYSKEQIMEMQTVLLGFKSVTDDVFESASQEIINMSTVMGMDLKSAVQTVGKALDDPIAGLGSLSRQGFVFDEAQKQMLQSMVELGDKAGAQKIILDELKTTYGGTAEAGIDSFRQLELSVGDLQSAIGEVLIPVVTEFAGKITKLVEVFNNFDKGTQTAIVTVTGLVTVLPLVVKGIQSVRTAVIALQSASPIILGISVATAGILVAVGKITSIVSSTQRSAEELNKSSKDLLENYAGGNENKKLDAKTTQELIKLYPELSEKIEAYATTVKEASEMQKELNDQKIVAQAQGRLSEIDTMSEKYQWLKSQIEDVENSIKNLQNIIATQGDVSGNERQRSIDAYRKRLLDLQVELENSKEEIDKSVDEINKSLATVGKTLQGRSIVDLPEVEKQISNALVESADSTKKTWQKLLSEVLSVDQKLFTTGKEASKLYIAGIEEELKINEGISNALGEVFNPSDILEKQAEGIKEAISKLLTEKNVDVPFKISELSKQGSALNELVQKYQALVGEIKRLNIDDEIKDLRTQVAGLGKDELTLYADALKAKGATEEQLKEALKLKKEIIDFGKKSKDSGSSWEKWLENLKEKTNDWGNYLLEVGNIGASAFNDMFSKIGESLVDGGAGFEDFSAIAVSALADVLQGLAAQLSALATFNVLTDNYAKAGIAFAGATTALIASGALRAIANQMKNVSDTTNETNISLEQFVERLQNIKESNFSQLGLFSKGLIEYSKELSNAIVQEQKASQEYEEYLSTTYNEFLEKYNKKDRFGDHWTPLTMTVPYQTMKKYKKEYENWSNMVTKVNLDMKNALVDLVENSQALIDENQAISASYQELFNSIIKVSELGQNLNKEDDAKYLAISTGLEIGDISKTIKFQYEKYSSYVTTLENTIKSQIQDMQNSVYESMLSVGKDIGETFVSAIVEGATKSDFMSEIKNYIKKQMIQMVVLTDEFSDKMSEIGFELITAMTSETPTASLNNIRDELSDLFDEIQEKSKVTEDILTSVFQDITQAVDETTDEIESTINSVADLGEEIANQLIDGLSNGLSQTDFLTSMYTWIRKLIIQTVVYTESMKSEIESIGQTISEGLSKGFSETSLHELRRDLSYIFYSANQQMSGIDSILSSVFDGYATGTDSALKGLHIVGESGPELVDFKGGERVYNNADTMKILSGSGEKGNTFNVTFNNLQDTSAYTMMSQLRDYNRQLAINGIL